MTKLARGWEARGCLLSQESCEGQEHFSDSHSCMARPRARKLGECCQELVLALLSAAHSVVCQSSARVLSVLSV